MSGGGEEGLRMGTAFSYLMGLLTAEETNNIILVRFLKIILKLSLAYLNDNVVTKQNGDLV